MKINGLEVKRMKNPCPDKWPGPWFKFRYLNSEHYGSAHHTTLVWYIGQEAFNKVKNHFMCLWV